MNRFIDRLFIDRLIACLYVVAIFSFSVFLGSCLGRGATITELRQEAKKDKVGEVLAEIVKVHEDRLTAYEALRGLKQASSEEVAGVKLDLLRARLQLAYEERATLGK